jgi:hypothetical protein
MKYFIMLLMVGWSSVTSVFAAQTVTPEQANLSISSTGSFAYTPVYTVSAPDTGAATGLGLRIHFDSHAVQFTGVDNVFAYGMQPTGNVMMDTADLDGDPVTDSYVIASWVDYTAQWPGVDALPLSLLNAQFQPVAGFAGTTHIRATASSTANGTDFQGVPMSVTVTALTSGVKLAVRGFLQGAYASADKQMRDSLRTQGLIPLAQPYAFMGYAGGEVTTAGILATTGNDAPVDWVLVELRDRSAPKTVLAQQAALLQRDGDVADAATNQATLTFPALAAGDYYVALRHRNHLGVMTQAPVSLTATATTVDFTATSTALYGNTPTTATGEARLLWVGDVNHDNKLINDGPNNDKNAVLGEVITASENAAANTNFQLRAYSVADLNMDGKVIYAGPANEINLLLGDVLLHPGNATASTNYIVQGTLP